MEPVFFNDKLEFRQWLEQNHDKETELLVGFYKVGSGRKNMSWSESVDQALCYGWIDGVRRSLGADSYCIRFTPRKPDSNWSAINIKKVEALSSEGLMHQSGLDIFNKRKEANSAVYSYENEITKLPANLEKLFKKNKKAWMFFNAQAPSYKKTVCRWINSAKQQSTKVRRLEKVIAESEAGRRVF